MRGSPHAHGRPGSPEQHNTTPPSFGHGPDAPSPRRCNDTNTLRLSLKIPNRSTGRALVSLSAISTPAPAVLPLALRTDSPSLRSPALQTELVLTGPAPPTAPGAAGARTRSRYHSDPATLRPRPPARRPPAGSLAQAPWRRAAPPRAPLSAPPAAAAPAPAAGPSRE